MNELDNSTQYQYLSEMGIQQWSLLHPTRLSGYQPSHVELPETCVMLLVSPVKPEGEIVNMLEKVLKSIGLTTKQTLHLFPEQFYLLGEHQLEWVWFAGCEKQSTTVLKSLTSPLLTEIDGNNQHRRNLWQQICSYEN